MALNRSCKLLKPLQKPQVFVSRCGSNSDSSYPLRRLLPGLDVGDSELVSGPLRLPARRPTRDGTMMSVAIGVRASIASSSSVYGGAVGRCPILMPADDTGMISNTVFPPMALVGGSSCSPPSAVPFLYCVLSFSVADSQLPCVAPLHWLHPLPSACPPRPPDVSLSHLLFTSSLFNYCRVPRYP